MEARRLSAAWKAAPIFLAGVLAVAGCVTVGGGDPGALSGSAGAAGTEGTAELTRCPAQLATAAISTQNIQGQYLVQYGLPSDPRPALRLVMQQSNCVTVVHRDVALAAIKEERALAKSGELEEGSDFGAGQMVAADYTIIPEITFSEENAGGVGAAAASFMGAFIPFGGLVGAAAGGVRFKEAQVLLTLVDNRTGVQLAVASGTASGSSFGGLGGVFGTTSVAAGGYMNTAQGKVVIAAMIDAMNTLVPHLQATRPSAGATR